MVVSKREWKKGGGVDPKFHYFFRFLRPGGGVGLTVGSIKKKPYKQKEAPDLKGSRSHNEGCSSLTKRAFLSQKERKEVKKDT